MSHTENKKNIIKADNITRYLRDMRAEIGYNGVNYTISKDMRPIITLDTTDEINAYIMGWEHAMKVSTKRLEEMELKLRGDCSDENEDN